MPATEAQIRANQANGARSRGPVTPEGKAISSRNSLQHGMSGQGVVLPESDLVEIEKRVEAFDADMKPCSPAGQVLIRRMATLSVQMEIATRHEFAATARNVRHAVDDFDEAQFDKADALHDALGENPRKNVRKLRKFPEGVDRMIDAWTDLKADLRRDPKPCWTAAHLEKSANLLGLSLDHARGTRFFALSNGAWCDFYHLADSEGGDLDEAPRQAWCRAALIEQIDAEIAALEAHRETLDFEAIELDRAEAGERARFDTSKEGTLARRYASELQRNYFKALKEFRQVEAECLERAASEPTLPPPPPPIEKLGSSRDRRLPASPAYQNSPPTGDWNPILDPMKAGIDLNSPDPTARRMA